MTILFFGAGDDSCIELAVEAAVDLGVEFRLVDQRVLNDDEILLEVGTTETTCRARVAGEVFDVAGIGAIYARPLGIGESTQALAFSAAMAEWLDLSPGLVVNRPLSMRSNSSKPYQAQLIAHSGFSVPDTLVTNDPDAVLAFRARHRRVIFKSTSGIRSIVHELDASRLTSLQRIRGLPTQFQEHIDGVDIRVHVVGDSVFPTRVVSDAMDYRYARQEGADVELETMELDEDTSRRCVELAARLDLPLCGIDLRQTPDGRLVCFEVNPMPAFSYYETNTGQPIARTLVEFLAEND